MKILVVDDDAQMRGLLSMMLEEHKVTLTYNGVAGGSEFMEGEFDLIISDFMMPRKNGAELLSFVRRLNKEIPFIMVTGEPDVARRHIKGDTGPFAMLQKPILSDDLEHAMKELGCVMYDDSEPQDEALELIKRAHSAIDLLFAMLIDATRTPGITGFLPSQSGEPWEVMKGLNRYILEKEDRHEGEGTGSQVQDSATGQSV